jgi:predicted outer membrane repeat protein
MPITRVVGRRIGCVAFIALVAFGASAAPAAVIYVKGNAAGANNGTSWANAYRHLQDALAAANSGDEVWVAAGTYRPDETTVNPTGTGDRNASFELLDGLSIQGHFAGTESDLSQRDLNNPANETILSGDLNGDDGPNFANYGENSYHVLTANAVSSSALLEGFTIRGGNGTGSPGVSGGCGLLITAASPRIQQSTFIENLAPTIGAAVLISTPDTAPRFESCAFSFNQANGNGGAIYAENADPLIFAGCSFDQNNSGDSGGALFSASSNLIATNCFFSSNSAAASGGALYLAGAGVNTFADLTNCVLADNSISGPGGRGGAIFSDASFQAGNPRLSNCTLSDNTALGAGARGGGLATSSPAPSLANCILWGNLDSAATPAAAQVYVQQGAPVLQRCIVQGGWSGMGANNSSDDPRFRDPLNFDFRLLADSPAIDAGDNATVLTDTLDLDGDGDTAEPTPIEANGRGRFREFWSVPDTGAGAAPIIDLGAYEHVGGQVLVSPNPIGTSWIDDTDSLQAALYFARSYPDEVTEIWVAAGVYKPDYYPGVITPGDRTASFELVSGVALYDDFATAGTQFVSARPAVNGWTEPARSSMILPVSPAAIHRFLK